MRAPAASWDRIFEMNDLLACQFAELLGTLTERGKDYKSALEAIGRGRAALAEPLPAPECDEAMVIALRGIRAGRFIMAHSARGGRWS